MYIKKEIYVVQSDIIVYFFLSVVYKDFLFLAYSMGLDRSVPSKVMRTPIRVNRNISP